MKAEILALLRKRGDYVSGQELCEHFGVSRTAVWKAVDGLRKEGYRIEAVSNRGYLLAESDEVYGRNEILSRLRTKWVGRQLSFYESIGSTNAQAKLDAENGAPDGALVIADMQTAGRGRRGRGWDSPAGANLYFTLILRPDISPDKAPMLTLVMALAVARGIGRMPGGRESAAEGDGCNESRAVASGIKWPNDVVMNGRKVCGILTEMSAERDYVHYVVIGVGVNVGRRDFPPELASRATSLEAELGFPVSRSALTAEILAAFEEEYETFLKKGDLSGQAEGYNALLVNRDAEVCVLDPNGEYRGIARGITETGELLVERPDGSVVRVYAGEVSVRGIYGYV